MLRYLPRSTLPFSGEGIRGECRIPLITENLGNEVKRIMVKRKLACSPPPSSSHSFGDLDRPQSGTNPCQEQSERTEENEYTVSIRDRKLDSSTFEAFFENLWLSFPEEKRSSFAHLDSLWFSLYLKQSWKTKVLMWIKEKHIFSKKYVFVPIVGGNHWRLLIFCHFGENLNMKSAARCMLLLDSVEMADPRQQLEPDIRKLVWDIYSAEGTAENKKTIGQIPLLIPKVPQQQNKTECGIYVLYFIKKFMEADPEIFSIAERYPYFMKRDWFTRESFEQFCFELDGQLSRSSQETNFVVNSSSDEDDIVMLP